MNINQYNKSCVYEKAIKLLNEYSLLTPEIIGELTSHDNDKYYDRFNHDICHVPERFLNKLKSVLESVEEEITLLTPFTEEDINSFNVKQMYVVIYIELGSYYNYNKEIQCKRLQVYIYEPSEHTKNLQLVGG